MLSIPIKSSRASDGPVGLALAGGGLLGGIYEIGALIALNESLEGLDFFDLDVYVGVSSGAFVASNLANQITSGEMARIFIRNESEAHPVSPSVFLSPAFKEYASRASRLPFAMFDAMRSLLAHPLSRSVGEHVGTFSQTVPNGVFENARIERFLKKLYSKQGRTNDFRKLKQKLFVIATDLDTGEAVRFGSDDFSDVPISVAIQASTALPGLYPPVRVGGRFFVDGALKRTVHTSVAMDAGAKLVFCVNPIVPFDAVADPDSKRRHDRLVDGGLPVVLSQTFRSLVHSRMEVGMSSYTRKYRDCDVVLLEPDRRDSRMFFSNVFNYSNRENVCEHAYQTTRHDLLDSRRRLAPILKRHGIKLRTDILRDPERHYDSNLPRSVRMGRRRYGRGAVTTELRQALDRLEQDLGGLQ